MVIVCSHFGLFRLCGIMEGSGEGDTPDCETKGRSIARWLRHTTRFSAVLQSRTSEALKRWACVASDAMRKAGRLHIGVNDRHSNPVAHCFQSDGWSALVQEPQFKASGENSVSRLGTIKKEFLKEVSIVKAIDIDNSIVGSLVLSPSRSLDFGQSCWHIFQSSLEHFPMLRQIGCKGPIIFLALQDGLFFDSFGRRHSALHEVFYKSEECEVADEEERFWLQTTDWCFYFRCVAHVDSSGLKWGMARHSSEEVMKKIHLSIRSLCNSSYTLRQYSSRFLLSNVVWFADDELPRWSWRKKYWMILGVDDTMLQDFEKANPVWEPVTKAFKVKLSLRENPMWLQILETIMYYGFTWITFSETRLGKIGLCGRRWMMSCSLGLDECYNGAMQEHTTSKYYASGYREADSDVRVWLAVAGFAAMPVEAMVFELFEDDRFFLRAPCIKDDMDMESGFISRCSERFFDEIAKVCLLPLSGKQLKHEVILSMHISRGYVHAEAFYPLTQDPWRLTQGDISENTESLKNRTEPPVDHVTCKMWLALKCGMVSAVHTRSMRLLQDQPSTVMLAEKGHAFAASSKKKHQILCSEKLMARSFGAETMCLAQRRKEDVKIEILEKQVEAMENAQPPKINNKQMFCSEFMKQQRDEKDACSRSDALACNRDSVSAHHHLWKEQDAQSKLEYSVKAEEENARRKLRAEIKLDSARADLVFAKRRKLMHAEQASGSTNCLDSFRFTNHELSSVADEFYDPVVARGQVMQDAWERYTRPPKEPEAAKKRKITDQEAEMRLAEEHDELRCWRWWMSQHRELFLETAIVFTDNPSIGYVFLLGKKTEQCPVVFLQGRRVRNVLPAFEVMEPGEVVGVELNTKFDCSECTYKVAGEIEHHSRDCQIHIYEQVKFTGSCCECPHPPRLFEDFVLEYPCAARILEPNTGKGRAPHISRDWFVRLQEEYPWLGEGDFPAPHAIEKKETTSAPKRSRGGMAVSRDLEEDTALEIRRRLEARRMLWKRDVPDTYFYVTVRGGVWTAEFKGTEADCISVYARACARDWCDRRGLPKSKSFAFTRFTEHGASMLCHEWHRFLHFFFAIWVDHACEIGYQYTREELDAYVCDVEFVDWAETLDADSHCFRGVHELLTTRPRN